MNRNLIDMTGRAVDVFHELNLKCDNMEQAAELAAQCLGQNGKELVEHLQHGRAVYHNALCDRRPLSQKLDEACEKQGLSLWDSLQQKQKVFKKLLELSKLCAEPSKADKTRVNAKALGKLSEEELNHDLDELYAALGGLSTEQMEKEDGISGAFLAASPVAVSGTDEEALEGLLLAAALCKAAMEQGDPLMPMTAEAAETIGALTYCFHSSLHTKAYNITGEKIRSERADNAADVIFQTLVECSKVALLCLWAYLVTAAEGILLTLAVGIFAGLALAVAAQLLLFILALYEEDIRNAIRHFSYILTNLKDSISCLIAKDQNAVPGLDKLRQISEAFIEPVSYQRKEVNNVYAVVYA